MRNILRILIATVLFSASVAAAPSITVNSVVQRWPWNNLVDINYTVSGGQDKACGVYCNVTFTANINGRSYPVTAYADASAFKLYLSDVGLLRTLAKVPSQVVLDASAAYTEFKGAMTENYVLNELVKAFGETPYYWTSGNQAEGSPMKGGLVFFAAGNENIDYDPYCAYRSRSSEDRRS